MGLISALLSLISILSSPEGDLLTIINDHRESIGVQSLKEDPALSTEAFRYAQEMSVFNRFSHTDSQGRHSGERLAQAGIRFTVLGENLARSQGFTLTAQQVFDGWMASPPHRWNIEHGSFNRIGVGVYTWGGSTYWVAEFIQSNEPMGTSGVPIVRNWVPGVVTQ